MRTRTNMKLTGFLIVILVIGYIALIAKPTKSEQGASMNIATPTAADTLDSSISKIYQKASLDKKVRQRKIVQEN